MTSLKVPFSNLLKELPEEQQEFISGGVVYQEEYHHEEIIEHSSKEEKIGNYPLFLAPLSVFKELNIIIPQNIRF